MNLWYTRLFKAHYFSVRRSRSSALRYARAANLDECQIYSWHWGMKPRWPPVPVSARSCRKKGGDCEQSIDISKFKIIETQFDRILAKKQNRGHSRIFDSHPLTFKYIDLTSGGQMDDPTFAWTGQPSSQAVGQWCGGSYLWSWVGNTVID